MQHEILQYVQRKGYLAVFVAGRFYTLTANVSFTIVSNT